MNTTSASARSHATEIHTIFGSAAAAESAYPSFARSLLFHAMAIAIVFAVVIAKPALIPSIRPSVVVIPVEAIEFAASDVGGGR